MSGKIKLDSLALEVTRRCNMNCSHCLRGDAQNVTLSKEIIDRVFECVSDCDSILLTGGEPLLEIDTIEYIVDKIIEIGWGTYSIQLTTNGTIKDERIIAIFDKFCKSANKRVKEENLPFVWAGLRVSLDEFHDNKLSMIALSYYKRLAKKYNEKIDVYPEHYTEGTALNYEGRLVDYVNQNQNEFVPYGKRWLDCTVHKKHRIKIVNGVVMCQIYICANGNVITTDDYSYENLDKLSLGNILNDDLSNILYRANDNCFLLCSERDDINKVARCFFVPGVSELGRVAFRNVQLLYNQIIHIRELAHEMFPFIPAQEIIALIEWPGNNLELLLNTLDGIFACSQYKNGIDSIEDMAQFADCEIIQCLQRTLNMKNIVTLENGKNWVKQICISSILNNPNEHISSPYELYGADEDIVNSELFERLAILNNKYKCGELNPSNDKVFLCSAELIEELTKEQ